MKNTEKSFITIGKIGATFGVKGWLKIYTHLESDSNILHFNPWYIGHTLSSLSPITIEDSKPHGRHLIIKLANINSPEEAQLFTGQLIAIQRSQLPSLEKDEYYWSDLEGLTVIQQQTGLILGTVSHLIETGSNDVLVIVHEGKEHAIPYLKGSVIKDINLAKKEIIVDWELI